MKKRRLVKLGAFLLLGAIVNVAVAWGCAIWIDIDLTDSYFRWPAPGVELATGDVLIVGMNSAGASRFICERSRRDDDAPTQFPSSMPRWVSHAFQVEHSVAQPMALLLDARGWPMRSMYAVGNYTEGKIHFGKALHPDKHPFAWYIENFAIPLGPLWPGFAINTIFYAAILGLLFYAPGMVRRTIRRRRRLCPACAYPIGINEVCTECGKPVPTQGRRV